MEQAANDIVSINNSHYNVSIIVCKANLQYIARLARHKNKSLCIVDGRADTHVFGYSWLPLFTVGPHIKKADIIGFGEMATRKQNLSIGPHATKVKDNRGRTIILRASHGVSNNSVNYTLLCAFEMREIGIIVNDVA